MIGELYPESIIVRAYSDNFLVLHVKENEQQMNYSKIDALVTEHELVMVYQHIDLEVEEHLTWEMLENKLLRL
jgi:hypothetical protein